MSTEVKLSDIKVAPRRKKRNLGDIESLKASIKDVGLLHPLVLRPGNHLVVGYRRMEALAQLGHKTAPAIVAANLAELNQALKAERDENTCREAPTPSYAVELGLEIEKAYKPTADAARAEGQKKGGGDRRSENAKRSSKTFTKAKQDNSKRTVAQAASASGMSHVTYDRAKKVIESGRPDLIEAMDRTGKVNGAYKKLKLDEEKAKIAKQVQASPNAPTVTLSDYRDWLEQQEPCDLLLTDPPYMTDLDDVHTFAVEWLPLALSKVRNTGRAFIFVGAYPEELLAYLDVAVPNQILVWTYRNTLGPSPKHDYKLNWQAILYYRKKDAAPLDCPVMVEQFSVQDITAPDGRHGTREHAWQKPDEIAERFVRHASKPGDTVYDCFAGTGTFLLAASKLGRRAKGCECDTTMLKIAKERGCNVAK